MRRLTKKEKYFVSCFVEKCNDLIKPNLGKTISLYTFLDGTSEDLEEQSQQIRHHDPLLSKILFDISNRVDDETFFNKKLKELQRRGFSNSWNFIYTFRSVCEWLWLVESDKVRTRVQKDFKRIKEEAEREKKLFAWPRSEGNKTFATNKSHVSIASIKREDVIDDVKENVEKPFNFELVRESIKNKLLSSLKILQILDRSSALRLTADQIAFLEIEYKNSINEISGSQQSVYVVDEQGRATFESQNLEKYQRIFKSDEEKFRSLKDDQRHNSRGAYTSPIRQPLVSRPIITTQIRKPNPSAQKIYYDHFFCERCSTPFEAPKDKERILCPCCGGKISRESKIK
jgi:hypothetical protein